MSTDKVLIGAYLDDTGEADAGAAYLFSTNGTLLTTFTNPTPVASDRFGLAVAAVGTDKVLIGAYLDDTGSNNAGAAYLFSTNGTLLTTFTNPTPAVNDQFGITVAAVGTDKVLIGANLDNTGATDAGAAYLFNTNGTLLTTFPNPTPDDDSFGYPVAALDAYHVLIGAYLDDTGATDAGAAYLFSLSPEVTTLPATPSTVTLNGTVNPLGLSTLAWFDWGTTTNYENQTAATNVGSGFSSINVSAALDLALTDLVAGETIFFRCVASNANRRADGAGQSFTIPIFTDINAGLPGVVESSTAWGDYDNDGRLDILLTGTTNGFDAATITDIWRNTGSGFTNIDLLLNLDSPLKVIPGWVAWGDYDNDGHLDIMLSGDLYVVVYSIPVSVLLRNTGSGFGYVPSPGRFVSPLGSVAWGDYDNDGRLDILANELWRNTGNGFNRINDGPGGTAWGDYDNDGRLDILYPAAVWRNTGSGFTNINAGLPGVYGSAAWGDYDNDGRLDILLTGTTNELSEGIAQVWRNTGSGFTNINAGLTGVREGSAAWGDYDNDGRLDILLSGRTNSETVGVLSQVWRNTGSGFTNINAGLPGVDRSVAWGDYDNDGRLDILLTGATNWLSSGGIFQIWRNNTPVTNTVPTAPTGLNATISGSNLTLSWNAATDGQSPAAGLTYNVRVGSTPGGENIVGPMAAGTGHRRLPQLGNAQQGLTAIIPIIFGQTNYCSVQAVDSAFAGSPFSTEVIVKVLQWEAPPIIVPLPISSLPIGDYNGNRVIDESELSTLLANYFASSPWLYMTNVAGLGGTNVTFALTNSTAGAFSVEYTTNLADWEFLGPATPRYEFNDPAATNAPQRYYRLRWP